MKIKSFLYKALKYSNDVNAVSKGPKATGKRIGRRIAGKATEKLFNKIFK